MKKNEKKITFGGKGAKALLEFKYSKKLPVNIKTEDLQKELIKKLRKEYGDGSHKALCIFEDSDGGCTQRPALEEVIKLIKNI